MEDNVNIILNKGYKLIIDLLAQANNLSVSFSKEAEKGGVDGITSRALKTSLVMIIFNSLEGFCNFTSQLITYICTQNETLRNRITQTEIDFLLEQETYLDTRTGNLKISRNKYSSTLDKMSINPLIFSRIHGGTFRLDKGNETWRTVVKFKEIRDESTHIKFDINQIAVDIDITSDLGERTPAYYIDNIDLYFGIESVREYIYIFNNIIKEYYPRQKKFMDAIDLLYYMVLMNLQKPCGIANNKARKLREPQIRVKKDDIA